MKFWKVLPLLAVASLTACEKYRVNDIPYLLFDTEVYLKIKMDGGFAPHQTYNKTIDLLKDLDKLSDAYKKREDVVNVYDLNQTNEKLKINRDLYDLLDKANAVKEDAKFFNPLMGSLSKLWKEALHPSEEGKEPRQLTNEEIQLELDKINASSLVLEEKGNEYYAQRVGEALIDVGAIAKGFALDRCYQYLSGHSTVKNDYLLDLGKSSLLLGINSDNPETNGCGGYNPLHGTYLIEVEDLKDTYIRSRNSFVSTSSVSEQGVTIDGTTYSHIVSPETGSVINNYDAIMVIIPDSVEGGGALGDALSTSFMMCTKNEIKEYDEKNSEISVIAIKDGKIDYRSEGITLYKSDGQEIA